MFAVAGVYIDNSDDYIETGFFDDSDIASVGSVAVSASIAKQAQIVIAVTSDATVTGTDADFATIEVNIASGLDTTASRLRQGDVTVAIVTQTTDVTAKRKRGGTTTIAITPATTVVADAVDADIAVVNITSTSSSTAKAEIAPSVTIPVETSIVATAGGVVVSRVRRLSIVSASTLPYGLEDGYDYTWDNVGLYADWDNWPDNVWGEFSGLHIPITSGSDFGGGLQITGDITIQSTSAVSADANKLRNNTIQIDATTLVDVAGGRIRDTQSTIDATSAFSVGRGRLRNNTIDITATSAVSLEGFANPETTIASTSSLNVDAGVVYTGLIDLPITSTVEAGGSLKIVGQVNITLATVVVNVGTVRDVDPYRTASIDSETRTIRVLDDDLRTVAVDCETRGIMVLEETRKTPLDSETRQYRLALPPLVGTTRINQ